MLSVASDRRFADRRAGSKPSGSVFRHAAAASARSRIEPLRLALHALQPVLAQLAPERGARDAELLGGAGGVAAMEREHALDVLLFDLGERPGVARVVAVHA